MKLQIVDFETAKDLKDLGFDWECNLGYCFLYDDILKLMPKGLLANWSAPEQALVIKWFRDVHHIYIQVEPHFKQWFWEIRQLNIDTDSMAVYYVLETQRRTNPNAYKTFEEAELGGIKEVIKYLKNETISNK